MWERVPKFKISTSLVSVNCILMEGQFNGISFSGRMGSGKNYLAELLRKNVAAPRGTDAPPCIRELSFGIAVKRFCQYMLDASCIDEQDKNAPIPDGFNYNVKLAVHMTFFDRGDDKDWLNKTLHVSGTPVCTYLELIGIIEAGIEAHKPTTRGRLLQVLGTDIVRKQVHADFWVETLRHRIVKLNKEGVRCVVTDARFPNEIRMLEENGVLCLYVRSSVPYTGTRDPNHESERALDGMRMRTLVNDRTPHTDAKLDGLLLGTWGDVCAKLAMVKMQEVGSK
jgi:hypothetical protein